MLTNFMHVYKGVSTPSGNFDKLLKDTVMSFVQTKIIAASIRGEQKTDLKPNRNREEPVKTKPKPKPKKIKPNRFNWFSSGYIAKPNRTDH